MHAVRGCMLRGDEHIPGIGEWGVRVLGWAYFIIVAVHGRWFLRSGDVSVRAIVWG